MPKEEERSKNQPKPPQILANAELTLCTPSWRHPLPISQSSCTSTLRSVRSPALQSIARKAGSGMVLYSKPSAVFAHTVLVKVAAKRCINSYYGALNPDSLIQDGEEEEKPTGGKKINLTLSS